MINVIFLTRGLLKSIAEAHMSRDDGWPNCLSKISIFLGPMPCDVVSRCGLMIYLYKFINSTYLSRTLPGCWYLRDKPLC